QLTVVSCGLTVTATDGAPPDLEELDHLLHAQHALWARLAARGGGVVAAVGGGSVLLAFGYPQAREDDAGRAARTALRIAGALSLEPAGERRLPELSRALPIFRLTGEPRSHAALDSIPLVRETPLVGRRQQLAQLLDAWRRMQAGRGGAVLVTGEPGIGKSRLVRELRRRVPADIWFEARCVAEQQDSPLRPVAEMIAALGEPLESMLRRRGLDPAETLPPLAAALSLPLDPRWPRPQLT